MDKYILIVIAVVFISGCISEPIEPIKQSCSEVGGELCGSESNCVGDLINAADGVCCSESCSIKPKLQTCLEMSGLQCSADEKCSDALKISSDSASCCTGSCQKISCSDLNGSVCQSASECQGNLFSVSDTNICCDTQCAKPLKTCSEQNGFSCQLNEFCQDNVFSSSDSNLCCSSKCQQISKKTYSLETREIFTECIVPKNRCESGNCKVAVAIDEYSFSNLQSEIFRYLSDIKNDLGVQTELLIYPQASKAEKIRNDVLDIYHKSDLIGIVLVGWLPTAYYNGGYQDSYYPSDYIYVDNNNFCTEYVNESVPVDGKIIEGYYNSTTPLCRSRSNIAQLDYWNGRITPPIQGQEGLNMLKNYFDRNHAYRTGQLSYDKKLLAYYPIITDNPKWNNSADSKNFSNFQIETLYNSSDLDIIQVEKSGDMFNSDDDYLSKLSQPYEFVYYNGHGLPYFHQGNITWDKIGQANPQALFYSFSSCSVGRFTTPYYMAGQYIFSGGLVAFAPTTPIFAATAVIGSGFSEALAYGLTFGDIRSSMYGGTSGQIIGDPTLKMRVPSFKGGKACINETLLDFGSLDGATGTSQKQVFFKIYNKGNENLEIVNTYPKPIGSSASNSPVHSYRCGGSYGPQGGIPPGGEIECFFNAFVGDNTSGTYFGVINIVTDSGYNKFIQIPFKAIKS